MLKLKIFFPQMKNQMNAVPMKFSAQGEVINKQEYHANWKKWYDAEHAAMTQLEETAIALANERVRRKSHEVNFFSDYIGFQPDYENGDFTIEAWRLCPELIDTLKDLQSLGSFQMRFENGGEHIDFDWWQNDELEIYNPGYTTGATNYDFDALIEAAEQNKEQVA